MTIPAEAVTAATKAFRQVTLKMPFPEDQEIAQAVLDAAAPHIRASERERVYTELGNDHHYVIFGEDGYTMEHTVDCRRSGHMHECGLWAAFRRSPAAGNYDPAMAGRWRITGVDGDGLPELERAEETAQ